MADIAVGALLGAGVAVAAVLLKDQPWRRSVAIFHCPRCGWTPQRRDKKIDRDVPNTMKVNRWQLEQLRKHAASFACPDCGGPQEVQLLSES